MSEWRDMHSLLPWLGVVGSRIKRGSSTLASVRRERGRHRDKWLAKIFVGLGNSREFNSLEAAKRWSERQLSIHRVD